MVGQHGAQVCVDNCFHVTDRMSCRAGNGRQHFHSAEEIPNARSRYRALKPRCGGHPQRRRRCWARRQPAVPARSPPRRRSQQGRGIRAPDDRPEPPSAGCTASRSPRWNQARPLPGCRHSRPVKIRCRFDRVRPRRDADTRPHRNGRAVLARTLQLSPRSHRP